jgi:hypothetical protein
MQDAANNVVATDTSGKYALAAGTYTAQINLDSNATESKSPVYVVISVSYGDEGVYYYLTFENGRKEATQAFHVGADSAAVSFTVSWVKPVSANAVGSEAIVIGEVSNETVSEPSTETTTPVTEPSTEATTIPTTEPSQEETEATQQTTEPVESSHTETTATTDPVEETRTSTTTATDSTDGQSEDS